MKHFLTGLWRAMKSGFYMKTENNQLIRCTEKKLQSTCQSQTCPEERSGSVFGGLVPVWSTTAFWIPVKPYSWEVCSTNWWGALKTAMPAASIGQQNGPNSLPQCPTACHMSPMLQKLNELGYKVLPHLPYSPDLSQTNYHFFKHLNNILQQKRFHNQQEAEDAFHEFLRSWRTDFYTTAINKLISHWQKVLTIRFLFWLRKMCLSLVIMI